MSNDSCLKPIIEVLLVEDNPHDAALVTEALKETSGPFFRIETVGHLKSSLVHLIKRKVDVVLLDLALPDAKGLETLTKTRAIAPTVPIVVLTGCDDGDLAIQAIQNGAEDYLVKDQLEGRWLVHCICHAIERHRLNGELEQAKQQYFQNQKLQSLGILAGGIAHDFNNLLTVISTKIELALGDVRAPSSIKETLEPVKTLTLRATELCKQLLAYAGRGTLAVELTDLNQILREMSSLLQSSVCKKIQLKYELAKNLPLIEADPSQLRQLITYLVLNASEAIGERSGNVTVSTGLVRAGRQYLDEIYLGLEAPEGDYIYLEVKDTGCGMDDATRNRMFEPFFSTKFSGKGLGLAAVLGIARVHKGALEVASEKGRGSSFKVLFPCKSSLVCNDPSSKEMEIAEAKN